MNNSEDHEYLYMRIASHAAPTLMDMKPSSLISLSNNSRKVMNIWEENKDRIADRLNLHYFELLKSDKHVSILFYRKDKILQTIEKPESRHFLKSMGHPAGTNLEDLLQSFKQRFQKEFPHEIGILLGYPLEDVKDFIRHKGSGSLLCGYWKVYHNPDQALQVFRKYDLAKEMVMKLIAGLKGEVRVAI